MTASDFRNLMRGDLVEADGNGWGVVSAVYFQDGVVKADIRMQADWELVCGLSEEESDMIHRLGVGERGIGVA